MSNLNLHNINFTVNTDETIDGFVTKRTKSDLVTRDHKYDIDTKRLSIDENINTAFINAVDIDWNNAEFKVGDNTTVIDTTGKLLSTLSNKFNEIKNAGYITLNDIPETDLSEYAKTADIEEVYQPKGNYLTEHQNLSEYAKTTDIEEAYQPKGEYLTEHQDLSEYAKTADITGVYATKETVAALANTVDGLNDVYQPKGNYLTEHQSLEDYATKTYVDTAVENIVGAAPENFDTLKELADSMTGLKVIDVEAVPAVPAVLYGSVEDYNTDKGTNLTQEEFDALTEEEKIQTPAIEGVEEVSHNMTIAEFVTSSMQAVDEKEEVEKIQAKYSALLTLLNLRETDINNVMINQELENNTTVTFDEPVDNIVIPLTNKTYKITAPLDDNTTINLTSSKAATVINTADNTPNITINAPEVAGATSQAPNVSLQGNFNKLTLENISVTNTSAGLLAPVVPITVNEVEISANNTRTVRINAAFNDGAIVRNNSNSDVILQNMNSEDPTDVTIIAAGSTVTLYGTWNTVDAEVGDNTLIINPAVRINTLIIKRGNVLVKSAYVSDCITNVINDPANYEEVPQNETGLWKVEALVNEVDSLTAFKKVASTPSIVKFTDNIQNTAAITYGITTSGHIVYDLDGHTYSTTNTSNSAVILARGSNLTLDITGGGSIIGPNNINSYGIWLRAATSSYTPVLNIYDCTVMGATHTLYAESGIINVYGGTFKMYDFEDTDKDVNGNFKFLLNCLDANYQNGTAQINVYGGKFWDFDPSNAYGEPGAPVSYVPKEGYDVIMTTVVENDVEHRVYEVKPISE